MSQLENSTNLEINDTTVRTTTENTKSTFDIVYFNVYFVILPIIFIIGIPGNIAIFVQLVRKAKREVSYIFHGFITMNAVICLSGCSLIMANWYWCENMMNAGPLWIRRSSILMYSSAFIFDQTCNVLITAAPCLTLTCSIDRFVAIYFPMAYMSYTTETRRNLIILSSIGIYLFGTLLSISDIFRNNVNFDPISATYIVSEDGEYIAKLLPKILVAVRSCFRIVVIFVVIVVNILIMVKFHLVSVKKKKLTDNNVGPDQGKTKQKPNRDQAALAAMLFVQTILMVIGHVPMSISYILIYVDSQNSSSLTRKYFNMFVNVAFCAEMACIFIVLLLTNRKLASSLLKCCGSKDDALVTMAPTSKMK